MAWLNSFACLHPVRFFGPARAGAALIEVLRFITSERRATSGLEKFCYVRYSSA